MAGMAILAMACYQISVQRLDLMYSRSDTAIHNCFVCVNSTLLILPCPAAKSPCLRIQ